MGMLAELVAGALCIAGGILLFAFASAGDVDPTTGESAGGGWTFGGDNVFEVLTHGVGLYCVGRGLLIIRQAFDEMKLNR